MLVHRQRNWVRISAAAALCYRWDGRRARLYLHLRPGSYNDESLIEFIRQLRRHFRGQQVLLLWDGLNSHHSHTMRRYLEDASWPTAATSRSPTPSLPPNPVPSACAATNSCFSASSPTPVFLYDQAVMSLCEVL